MKKYLLLLVCATALFQSCTENYSNGERVGFIAKFSKKGVMYKTWEGHLNMTQTGMNTADGWDFSIDADNEPAGLVDKIDSAVTKGYKVKLVYHQLFGKNWTNSRGETEYMVTDCIRA